MTKNHIIPFIFLAFFFSLLMIFIPTGTVNAQSIDDFIITVDIPSDLSFTIPTYTGEDYYYDVDCDGDGTPEETGLTGDYTCVYKSTGVKEIHIHDGTGEKTGFPRIFFNGVGDAQKLLTIEQWGTGLWSSMANAFKGCSNLQGQAKDTPNLSNVNDMNSMFNFIEQIREVSGKPVGIKMVIGSEETFEELVSYMAGTNRHPDFITIDGGEGGTGATYQAMADSVGLPIKPALLIAQKLLQKYKVRDKITLIASGKLYSPDRIAIALSLGADVVQIARGLMIAVGCIGAQKCHSNECPVGVATTNPKLQKALVVDEKRYRVTNYITTLREELYMLAAAAGITSPRQFNEQHIVYVGQDFQVKTIDQVKQEEKENDLLLIS